MPKLSSEAASVFGLIDRPSVLRLAGGGLLLTLVTNMVGLVSPMFFTQVYDRVLSTGSGPTLIVLTLSALVAIGLGAAFEQWRTVVFTKLGANIYVDLEPHAFRASHAAALTIETGRRSRPLDDLEAVRQTISGPLPGSLLDLFFAPFLLAILYIMNVWLGHFALLTVFVMAGVTVLTQWTVANSIAKATESAQTASGLAESHLRSAESSHAMGYQDRTLGLWAKANRDAVKASIGSAATAGGLTATGRAVRSGAQILIISIAAALVISGQISAGVIIAASIILGRLLAPIDALLGGWRQLAQSRLAAQRLIRLLGRQQSGAATPIDKPAGVLVVDNLVAAGPDGTVILRGVSFSVNQGESIAIMGRTGAGKSTLLKCLMGTWPRMNGVIRLGGTSLVESDRRIVGKWLGYLPAQSELSPGTIGENISRFDVNPHALAAATKLVGAEALIASFPKGFDTTVGELGGGLSSGQRRRFALARALYGSPSLVCLDEPEANLDRDGELGLAQALQQAKAAGTTVIIAAHRPTIIAHVDKVMVLNEGRIVQFGPAAEVLASLAGTNVRRAV